MEVVGNVAIVAPAQIGATWLKVGAIKVVKFPTELDVVPPLLVASIL